MQKWVTETGAGGRHQRHEQTEGGAWMGERRVHPPGYLSAEKGAKP